MMSDLKTNFNTDYEISENHFKLIDAVKFDKDQRIRNPDRSEPSLEISEFHLVQSGIINQNAVKVVDLAKTLKEKCHTDSSKKIKTTKINTNVIPAPAGKLISERTKRIVGFENTKKKLARWTGIIARNRTAASITFPLSQTSMKLESTNECIERFHLRSELEQKLATLEPVNDVEEDKHNFSLTLQEISQRRKEAARFRAQQSYKDAKAHRQNKIKSKKFHRIQRKQKFKKTLKEFDDLQKIDSHTALEKFEQLDRIRVKERMTLRHKNTGQWAKNKQILAKYDNNTRQMLVEQLSIGRELTQKIKTNEDSDDDNNFNPSAYLLSSDKDNPWVKSANSQSEIDEFIDDYRKYCNETNKINDKYQSKADNKEIIVNNSIENDKVFKEWKSTDLSKSEHSLKTVCDEFSFQELNDNYKKNSNSNKHGKKKKDDCMDNAQSIEKLCKNSRSKFEKKTLMKARKAKISKEKSGTSLWLVTSTNIPENNTLKVRKENDVDEVFQLLDKRLQKNVCKLPSKLKCNTNQKTKCLMKVKKIDNKTKGTSACDINKLNLKGQAKLKPIISRLSEGIETEESLKLNVQTNQILNKLNSNNSALNSVITEIDPKRFINIKSNCLKSLVSVNVDGELVTNNEAVNQHQIISEAFADDNVVEDFRNENKEQVEKKYAEDVNLSLPGWGSWSGKNIKHSARKKRHFIMKNPREELRRDENKGDVVIIEEKCAKIKQHLVSELPFPFSSVQDFEASVRAPLGRDFVPEKMFNKLIQPSLKTKMGKIIEPMTENVLVKT